MDFLGEFNQIGMLYGKTGRAKKNKRSPCIFAYIPGNTTRSCCNVIQHHVVLPRVATCCRTFVLLSSGVAATLSSTMWCCSTLQRGAALSCC
ncbi:hypothetical protein Y032_0074g836 [Ancylostoma ceylanicum]|uniref:Uncharacterized protein n=1 Tax=Ancylostoma ceylanicum TaxID=53326 RepID=A0A016TVM5_9BILA|nr:hypothetical protein Y032_0074g836 [Ancylostoma ceylanicum]